MHIKILKYLLVYFSVVWMISCETKTIYSDYQQLNNGIWQVNDTIHFKFSELDSLANYNVYLNVRNDIDFAYSNLFLITELDYPNGKTVTDTLEYEMALPDGTWLGEGSGSIKESKLWYREDIVFPDSGIYKLKVLHAMRQNGSVEGISNLRGLTDIGLEITKSTK